VATFDGEVDGIAGGRLVSASAVAIGADQAKPQRLPEMTA
jgi:hypothetical protein